VATPNDKWFLGFALAGYILTMWPVQGQDLPQFGPAYQRFELTLTPGERTEAVGPFYSLEYQERHRTLTLAPVYSEERDPDTDSIWVDIAYPFLSYRRFGGEYRFQFFQLLSFAGGQNQDAGGTKRFTLFPLYFQQRSTDTNENYTAFLPFYGHLKDRLFRDEVDFFMFPFYVRTRKKDIVTENYLAPFYHRRHGLGLTGWQLWPFIGKEHKDLTTITNRYDELVTVGGHDKLFVLWPFYFRNQLGIGTTNPVSQRAMFPFFSLTRSPLRDSTTYLWPLGVTVTDDREKRFHEVDAPWPLVVFAHGEGKTTHRVWPFFSQAHTEFLESDFYLWPLFKFNRAHSDPLDRTRTRLLYFVWSDIKQTNTETGKSLRRRDLWPLYTGRTDFNGNSRHQVLALLEPLFPNNRSIERDFAPVWSLWRAERNPGTGAASQSLLWNLYRRETSPEGKKFSLLFGLIRYQSDANGSQWRWFFIPSHKSKNHVPERR